MILLPPLPIADRRVFSANGVVFTVADVARRASVGGREAVFPTAGPEQVEELFRRSRGLLRADQLETWLATWQITPDDFRCWTDDVASTRTVGTASGWCHLLCSGEFDEIAAELAAAAAAACELGGAPSVAADFDPGDWTERLLASTTTDEHLTAVIDAHRLDWTRLETLAVLAPRREVAEELRHQVLTDGADLGTAAQAAGCPTEAVVDVLASITAPAVRAAVAGARAGEVVGPLPTSSSWTLVGVRTRTEPNLADPSTRARAVAAVRTDAITRAVLRHVVA